MSWEATTHDFFERAATHCIAAWRYDMTGTLTPIAAPAYGNAIAFSPLAIARAHAIAKAHGHAWAGLTVGEIMAALPPTAGEQQEYANEVVATIHRLTAEADLIGIGCQHSAPSIVEGTDGYALGDSTGTGRLAWWVDVNSIFYFWISRPGVVAVLVGRLDENGQAEWADLEPVGGTAVQFGQCLPRHWDVGVRVWQALGVECPPAPDGFSPYRNQEAQNRAAAIEFATATGTAGVAALGKFFRAFNGQEIANPVGMMDYFQQFTADLSEANAENKRLSAQIAALYEESRAARQAQLLADIEG